MQVIRECNIGIRHVACRHACCVTARYRFMLLLPLQVIIRQRDPTDGELADKARKIRRLYGEEEE